MRTAKSKKRRRIPVAPVLSGWRSIGTGLCFAGFWLLTLVAIPTVLAGTLVAVRDRERRVRQVRRWISLGFRSLIRAIELLRLAEFRIEGEGHQQDAHGCLIVANHPSFLDAVVLLGLLPDANCIMKSTLRRHPLFAPFVRAGRYLANTTDPMEAIEQCRQAKSRGEPILIFPEGTRTRPGVLPQFQRGAAQIALRANMDILPAVIFCTPPVLTHGIPWYRMPAERVRVVIRFHAPRAAGSMAPLDGLPLPRAARRLTKGLQDYFTNYLADSDHAHLRSPLPPPASGGRRGHSVSFRARARR